MTVKRIGFAYNPTNADATELAERAAGWCQVRGIEHWTLQAADLAGMLGGAADDRRRVRARR